MNVVHFRTPETFERYGIEWTRDARSDRERSLREAFLTYETSCGPNGLVSVFLLAVVCRRQGAVAGMKLRKHQDDALEPIHDYLARGGTVW